VKRFKIEKLKDFAREKFLKSEFIGGVDGEFIRRV
jgi:hypothetical protein